MSLSNIVLLWCVFHCAVYTAWRKKTSWTFACIIHPSSQNESVQKHIRNDQTSLNMCRNFCLKRFCISRDTNKIASHTVKQFLHWVIICVASFTQATLKRHSRPNRQSTN